MTDLVRGYVVQAPLRGNSPRYAMSGPAGAPSGFGSRIGMGGGSVGGVSGTSSVSLSRGSGFRGSSGGGID